MGIYATASDKANHKVTAGDVTYGGEGHDGNEAEGKAEGSIPVEKVGEEAEGYEDEEDVEV